MKFAIVVAATFIAFTSPLPALAEDDHHKSPAKAAPSSAPLADGEVRRVDKDAGKITIKHGPIPSLDMPPMTMVFQVKDPALLDTVKAGDKIKFEAERIGGQYTVTRLAPAN